MNEIEQQAHDQLRPGQQRRLRYHCANRTYLAQVTAEFWCWGFTDIPSLYRQAALTEEAIYELVQPTGLGPALALEYVVADAALIHVQGHPPADFNCCVCHHGELTVDDLLARYQDLTL